MKEFLERNTLLPIVYVIVQGCQTERDFYQNILISIIEHFEGMKAIDSVKTIWNRLTQIIPEIKGFKLGQITDTEDQIYEKLSKYFIHSLSIH